MMLTPPAFQTCFWLTEALLGMEPLVPRADARDRLVLDERPACGGPLGLCEGSGGDVRLPCPLPCVLKLRVGYSPLSPSPKAASRAGRSILTCRKSTTIIRSGAAIKTT